jgi:hypothetical protein
MEELMELYGISVTRFSADRWKAENHIDYCVRTSPSKAVSALAEMMVRLGVGPVAPVVKAA